MKAVFRRAAGQRRSERRRPRLEVGARAEHRVGVDDGAGVAPGEVLAEVRLVEGLVVDAGVGGDDVHPPQRGDQLALLRHLAGVLPEPLAMREVDAARVGGGGDLAAGAQVGLFLQPGESAVAHHLDVAHHVDAGDRHEAPRVPEAADLDLVFERAPLGFATLAGEDGALLARELQAGYSPLPGSGSKYFSNLPGTSFQASASGGGVPLRVMFGHLTAKSAFSFSHFSAFGSESARIAFGGHSGSQTPQSMHSSGWMTSMLLPS